MSRFLGWLSWLVTVRPYLTLLVLVIITVLMAAGSTLREPPIDGVSVVQVPAGDVSEEIGELFTDSGEVSVVTLVFRGEALTPGGLSQMDALIDDIVRDPSVSELLAPADPIIAPASLIKTLLQVDNFESVTQAEIDETLNAPEVQGALAAMTGTDTDGTPVAIAALRLNNTSVERVEAAELRIRDMAAGDEGPLRVSSVSPAVIQDEYREATETGMLPLIGLALLLIVALLLLFLRTLSDLLLTLTGLLLSLIWVVGAEGWLGPGALGLIGPPSSLTVMVPIIVISLTVDYAIQTVSHYREQRVAGQSMMEAVRTGLQNVTIPLGLAAAHYHREPVGQPLLSHRGDWRLRRRSGAGRGNEPDSNADAPTRSPDDHRPATRGARHLGSAPANLERIARCRKGGGVAGYAGHTQARSLHRRRARRDRQARIRGHRSQVGIQRPRRPA